MRVQSMTSDILKLQTQWRRKAVAHFIQLKVNCEANNKEIDYHG